ncbi:hypothetical protein ACIGXM_14415 [Kitasatospora sp. NPDC052896]|uniref:hypothetical protein n=1 Tax=Kitasatospora sp. NPDC052896 TaxID=3364061 RepID=UPI0037CAFEA3
MKLFSSEATVEVVLGRCQLGGTRLAVEGVDMDHEPGAILPDGSWRDLTPDEARGLCGEPDVRRRVRILSFGHLTELTTDALAPYTAGAHYLGRVRKDGGTLTTTVNRQIEKYIGLHVDNWDRMSSSERLESRPRLMVNLGPGPRWLLVASLDGVEVLREVDPDAYAEDRSPHTDYGRAYVARGDQLSVIRVRIDPGEGYIAPTELLVHDGSLEGFEEASTGAFWLGHFPEDVLSSLL